MKKNLYLFIAALAITTMLSLSFFSVESSHARGGDVVDLEVKYHTVVRGDTLWDISEEYLEDPFRWPNIWQKNPQIANPHLIYPGDIIKFTKDSIEIIRDGKTVTRIIAKEEFGEEEEVVVVLKEEKEVVEKVKVVVVDEGPDVFTVPGTMKDGFITEEALRVSGVILEPKRHKIMLAPGDETFVSFKKRDDIKEGDLYTIFKEGREIHRDDEKGTLIGHVIEIIGTVEIIVGGKAAEATVVAAYQEIEKGMKLTDYIEPIGEVELIPASDTITSTIVAADSDAQQIAETNLIYLGDGGNVGFEVGNVLEISRPRADVDDPMKKKAKVNLPNRVIGKAVVLRVTSASAMAFVINSSIAIIEGDTVTARPDAILN